MNSIIKKLPQIFASRRFFIITIIFFIFEATWIALSAAYPMAFDENYHFGLIQTYSHYLWPWLTSQPPHANAYGAVARHPSYLYHYLMSFPYRLIKYFIPETIGQIIILRLMNVVMFTIGLILMRRVLKRVNLSDAFVNITILLYALIPIVPQLAAQISYDNLLIPLVAASILMTLSISDKIQSFEPSAKAIILLLSFSFFTSIVKYAFLPIYLGIVLFLMFVIYHKYKGQYKYFFTLLKQSWNKEKLLSRFLLIALLLFSFIMFAQRDLVNLVEYHQISPNCAAVLNVNQCKAYSPWYYNYKNHNKVIKNAKHISFMNPLFYAGEWIYWMWYRLFFAINGLTSGFKNYPPLPLPSAAAAIVGFIGIYDVIKWRRRVFAGNMALILLFLVSSIYIVALFIQGYITYRYTDVLENMNGRYLLPILLFIAAIAGRAISLQLQDKKNKKIFFAVIVLLFFAQGGGFLTFIERSNTTWYLQNKTVRRVNKAAHHLTKQVIVKGKKHYSTNFWIFN